MIEQSSDNISGSPCLFNSGFGLAIKKHLTITANVETGCSLKLLLTTDNLTIATDSISNSN